MKIRLTLPLQPMSINRVHCRDKRYLTTHFKSWSAKVAHYLGLENNKEKIQKLKKAFNPTKHTFHIEITHFYPRDVFYTVKDIISSKTVDISNPEKPLIDVIYLDKFQNSLKIDDKHITKMTSSKYASEDYLILIEIEIIPLKETDYASVVFDDE